MARGHLGAAQCAGRFQLFAGPTHFDSLMPGNPLHTPKLSGWRRLGAAGLLGLSMAGFASAEDLGASPIFTDHPRFRIPYQVDPVEIARLGAVQIQLHVSTDKGRHWRRVDSVPAVEGKFTFEAAADGEYWFAVRTIDRQGEFYPAGPLSPGLMVVVDRAAPQLELDAAENTPGHVVVNWTARDDHLDAKSLLLEFQLEQSQDWQAIDIAPQPSGQASWALESSGLVTVRGRVKDQAGNSATASGQVTVNGAPSNLTQAAPFGLTTTPKTRSPLADSAEVESRAAALRPATPADSDLASSAPSPQIFTLEQGPSPIWGEGSATAPTAPEEDKDDGLRHLNSTRFEVSYALDGLEASDVEGVDLYLTENGGAKWYHYGTEAEGRRPFEVTVPDDGTYGFTIRVRSLSGPEEAPPQPGDGPELTVVVDRVLPTATLHTLQQSRMGSSQQLLIEWTATDEALPEYPVSLSVGEAADGPWRPITSWQPNLGQYLWTIDEQVPSRAYVRLRIRDAAGNVTQVVSDQPVMIGQPQPTARVLDARSLRE